LVEKLQNLFKSIRILSVHEDPIRREIKNLMPRFQMPTLSLFTSAIRY